MAREYRPVDREQPFLLPPSMVDWLPDDHVVWFVIEAIKQLDTAAFHAKSKRGGVGRRGYDPDMLVTLFAYSLANEVRSSRKMERLCGTDVAFRIICANDIPDHTVLARFRQDHEQALADLLEQTLKLAARLGFVQFGTVALDGTKIAANASKDMNRAEGGLRKLAEQHLAETGATDLAEDALFGEDNRGDEVPEKLRDRTSRGRRIADALDVVRQRKAADERAAKNEQAAGQAYTEAASRATDPPKGKPPASADPVATAKARYDRQRARQQHKHQQWEARRAAGDPTPGRQPAPVDEHSAVRRAYQAYRDAQDAAKHDAARDATQNTSATEPAAREPKANVTDPESRLQKTRNGWLQGYNCQTAVSDDQFIVYAHAIPDTVDTGQYVPIVDAITALAERLAAHTGRILDIGAVLADAGYDSDDNLTSTGPDRLIANANRRTMDQHATDDPATGDPPEGASTREQMDHRLRTSEGHARYKRRAPIVETPNAWLKDLRGLRRFSRRGQTAAQSELSFASAITNLLHLQNLGVTTAQLANR